jgi:hypothetical protein
MFTGCKLNLLQRISSTTSPPAWLRVTISRPHVGGAGRAATYLEDIWKAIGEGYNWSGHWITGENHINNRPDTAYTIGTSVPQANKFWRYSISRRELEFVEATVEAGGGLAYGETKSKITRTAVLNGCIIAGRGFVPFPDDAPGRGIILVSSNIFKQAVPLEWENE